MSQRPQEISLTVQDVLAKLFAEVIHMNDITIIGAGVIDVLCDAVDEKISTQEFNEAVALSKPRQVFIDGAGRAC